MDAAEYAGIIRTMIQHEDTLRDQRVGWLFGLNGFLFTGLGFAWSTDDSTALISVLAVVGVVVAISSAVALYGNQRAIAKLADLGASRTQIEGVELPPVMALRSAEMHRSNDQRRWVPNRTWLYPWKLLPWCFAVVWAVLPVVSASGE
jgi:hypothetical protein